VNTSAGLVFLSWVRDGLAAGLTPGSPTPGSIKIGVEIAPQDETGSQLTPFSSVVTARLYGPGDVTGFDENQIIRIEPRPDSAPAEPHLFPFVEFARPDFPWQFSPEAPDKNRLHPWIVLIVTTTAPQPGLPLPVVKLPADEPLPDLEESWAWAHAQVAVSNAPNADPSDISKALRTEPLRAVSRLLCPRRLEPATVYYACIVPSYAAGCVAGLGGQPDDANATKRAWDLKPDGSLSLPVYYWWRFQTGESGDFETLARRLEPNLLPRTVGLRKMDVSHAGGGIPDLAVDDSDALVDLEGALLAPTITPEEWKGKAQFQRALHRILQPSQKKLIPPLYGGLHAGTETPPALDDSPHWLAQLNFLPQNRAVARLGTQAIQSHQEELITEAWDQAHLAAGNEVIGQVQLAHAVQTAMHRKRIDPAKTPAVTLLRLARPVLRKPPSNALIRSLTAPVHRRLIRPLGPLGRKVKYQPVAPGVIGASPLDDGAAFPVKARTRPAGMARVSFKTGMVQGRRTPSALWSSVYGTIAQKKKGAKDPAVYASSAASTDLINKTPGSSSSSFNVNLPLSASLSSDLRGVGTRIVDLAALLPPSVRWSKMTGLGALAVSLAWQKKTVGTSTLLSAEFVAWMVRGIGPNGVPTVNPNDTPAVIGPIKLGASEFWSGSPFAVGPDHWSFAVADIDGDGQQEIVVAALLDTELWVRAAKFSLQATRASKKAKASKTVVANTFNWNRVNLSIPAFRNQIRGIAFDFADLDGNGQLDLVLAVVLWKNDEPSRPVFFVGKNVDLKTGVKKEDWQTGDAQVPSGGISVPPTWEGHNLSAPFLGKSEMGKMGFVCSLVDLGGLHRPDLILAYPQGITGGKKCHTSSMVYWDLDSRGIGNRDAWSNGPGGSEFDATKCDDGAFSSVSFADLNPKRAAERDGKPDGMIPRFKSAAAENRAKLPSVRLAGTSKVSNRRTSRHAALLTRPSRCPPEALKAIHPDALSETRLNNLQFVPTPTSMASSALGLGADAIVQQTVWKIVGGKTEPGPLLAVPHFERPTYEFLRELSPELLVPGLAAVPNEAVAILCTNPVFIEAFMVGLNHEMSRELLWRGYHTDLRATYFRRFWDSSTAEKPAEIQPIAEWPETHTLGGVTDGKSPSPGTETETLALVVRGELLRRFPSAHLYAQQARKNSIGALVLDPNAAPIDPAFNAFLPPDIQVFGFPLTRKQALGAVPGDPTDGFFFVFEQHPTEVQFGLDEVDPKDWSTAPQLLTQWSDLRWSELTPDQAELDRIAYVPVSGAIEQSLLKRAKAKTKSLTLPISSEEPNKHTAIWGSDAAAMAHITFRAPFRLAVQASRLLGKLDSSKWSATAVGVTDGVVTSVGGQHPDGQRWRLSEAQVAWLIERGRQIYLEDKRDRISVCVDDPGGLRLPKPGEPLHRKLLTLERMSEDEQ
jgi:hypothetical protein